MGSKPTTIPKFLRGVWWCARHHCLTWHNVRASWIQSKPGWADRFNDLPPLTDEEWDEWQAAMDKM